MHGVNTKSTYRKAMKRGNSKQGINYKTSSNIGEGINSPSTKRRAGYGKNPVSTKGSVRSPKRR